MYAVKLTSFQLTSFHAHLHICRQLTSFHVYIIICRQLTSFHVYIIICRQLTSFHVYIIICRQLTSFHVYIIICRQLTSFHVYIIISHQLTSFHVYIIMSSVDFISVDLISHLGIYIYRHLTPFFIFSLKFCPFAFLELVARLANLSFSEGPCTAEFKAVTATPLLKNLLDPHIPKSFI